MKDTWCLKKRCVDVQTFFANTSRIYAVTVSEFQVTDAAKRPRCRVLGTKPRCLPRTNDNTLILRLQLVWYFLLNKWLLVWASSLHFIGLKNRCVGSWFPSSSSTSMRMPKLRSGSWRQALMAGFIFHSVQFSPKYDNIRLSKSLVLTVLNTIILLSSVIVGVKTKILSRLAYLVFSSELSYTCKPIRGSDSLPPETGP